MSDAAERARVKRMKTEREAHLGRELAASIIRLNATVKMVDYGEDEDAPSLSKLATKARELLGKEQSNG